jgi:hypothetical protein
MGKCETATASIGISILLSDLILQINETNFDLIKNMLASGYIEDDNDCYNDQFQNVLDCDKCEGNYIDVKEYLINKCRDIGDSSYVDGLLFERTFLLPLKKILENDRWGYDRYGTNCISRPIDFDLSVNVDDYKDIEKCKIVFILIQSSG